MGRWKFWKYDTRGVSYHDGHQAGMGKAGWEERIPYHHQLETGRMYGRKSLSDHSGILQEYLGENYDYVFGIHTDRKHCHGHIVFNSVNRITGYKYRYERGDWEKFMQPITDKLCVKYGLPKLEYEKETGKESHTENGKIKEKAVGKI